MIFTQPLGLISYGVALPELAIKIAAIETAQGKENVGASLRVRQKTVPAVDEDTITLAVTAAWQAVTRAEKCWGIKSVTAKPKLTGKRVATSKNVSIFDRQQIGCLWVGSESHPYAVKPSGTVVKEALGLNFELALADLQFACKAGTQGLQIAANYLASGSCQAGLAIGADVAQAAPGDALEFTAGAGAAAMLLGQQNLLARLLGTTSVASDTPDFWRRPAESYPQHGGRFTGEPAYFKHVLAATKSLLAELKLTTADIDWVVFHTPNGKFPEQAAKILGFDQAKLKPSLVVKQIGNTYAAASLIALAAVLDQAQPNQKILVTAYGSGAGSDSFIWETTPQLTQFRQQVAKMNGDLLVQQQISRLKLVDYAQYQQLLAKRSH